MTETEQSIARLKAKLGTYQQVRGKTMDFVLRKVVGELARFLSRRLRALDPVKGRGQIRAARLAALAAGEGLQISPRARAFADQKTTATARDIKTRQGANFIVLTGARKGRTWFQVAAERELSIRESAVDFLGAAAVFRGVATQTTFTSTSRSRRPLARGQISGTAEETRASLTWGDVGGPLAASAAEGMGQPKSRAATFLAIRDAEQNIDVYLERKAAENLKKAGLN